MGNIILTQKDADGILAYMREQLSSIDETKTMIKEAGKDLRVKLNKVIERSDVPEELKKVFDLKAFGDMMVASHEEKTIKELEERKSKVVRFIELLTIGSDTELTDELVNGSMGAIK